MTIKPSKKQFFFFIKRQFASHPTYPLCPSKIHVAYIWALPVSGWVGGSTLLCYISLSSWLWNIANGGDQAPAGSRDIPGSRDWPPIPIPGFLKIKSRDFLGFLYSTQDNVCKDFYWFSDKFGGPPIAWTLSVQIFLTNFQNLSFWLVDIMILLDWVGNLDFHIHWNSTAGNSRSHHRGCQ